MLSIRWYDRAYYKFPRKNKRTPIKNGKLILIKYAETPKNSNNILNESSKTANISGFAKFLFRNGGHVFKRDDIHN